VIRTEARGTRITQDSKSSPRRVDLVMAAVMAHDRAKELAGRTLKV
jgi:phage terminase large subunit-like protein